MLGDGFVKYYIVTSVTASGGGPVYLEPQQRDPLFLDTKGDKPMLIRSAIAACAVALFAAAAAAPANAQAPQRCEETSFRIYFAHGSASLDQTSLQAMALAERNVAGCSYRALRVSLDGSSPYASRRATAIRTAARSGNWDAVRVERSGMQQAAYSAGPEFAEVTMTPNALPPSRNTDNGAGV